MVRVSSPQKYMTIDEAEAAFAARGYAVRDFIGMGPGKLSNHWLRFSEKDTWPIEAVERDIIENWEPGLNSYAIRDAIRAKNKAARKAGRVTEEPTHVSLAVRFQILKKDNYRCRLCGASPSDGVTQLEIDHIIPRSKDGNNKPENLQTLCFRCNRGKFVSNL